ncbi:MAG TPA: hypothetical protein VK707_07210 [Solirubrobacteraceae bacterium]|jgi:hypothetical protein|nr:hypothetical protein [Solirubrobacteraceae bacterium]
MSQTDFSEAYIKTIAKRRERLRTLWEMTPAERILAMRRGELTLEQCAAWAARFPEQIPLVNGEYEYLAKHTPEASE